MIRPIPRTGESGGSSGWSASLTPASSATGTARSRNQASVSQSRSSSTGAPGAGAVLPDGRVEAGHLRATSARQRDRRARPRDDRHPVVTPHLDPEPAHHPQQLEHRLELLLAAREPEPEAVHRRVVLDHGEAEAGVLDLLPVERQRAVLPGLLGRVGAPVDEPPRQHTGRLLDPELAQLRPGRGGSWLEQDLGEAERHPTLPSGSVRCPIGTPVTPNSGASPPTRSLTSTVASVSIRIGVDPRDSGVVATAPGVVAWAPWG